MTDRATLLELAGRVEAEGPNSSLLGAIAVAAGLANRVHPTKPERCAWGDDELFTAAPDFLSSLDDAMLLALKGREYDILAEAANRCATRDVKGDFTRDLPAFVTAASLRALAEQADG